MAPNRGKNTVPPHCSTCKSRHKGVLCDALPASISLIENTKNYHSFKTGHVLFEAGHLANGIFCIVQGTVKLEALDSDGKTQIAQVYSKGSMIGYRALFTEENYVTTAIAVEDLEVCYIPKKTVFEIISKDPELALKFLVQLSRDFKMMESRLFRIYSRSANERIAEALLFLRENFEDKNWTRREIAEWAGTTTETVIRRLAEMEKQGMIRQEGRKIIILKRDEVLEAAKIFL